MDLSLHAGTAVDGNRLDPLFEFCKLSDFLAGLHGKLSGGTENQSIYKGFVILCNLFNDGNAECCGFACTGV